VEKPQWAFLTNHGRVLVYIAKYPRTTTRKIALEVGVTERVIQKIIKDLEADGYIVRQRKGRNNIYAVNPEMPMRHPMENEYAVGNLLQALGYSFESIDVKVNFSAINSNNKEMAM
jgi:DNA-binding Lrp family transcriptional regulator